MNITDTATRYIVVGIIAMLILGLGYTSFSGAKQDEQYEAEQEIYKHSLDLIEEEQFDQALLYLKQVEENYPESANVKYNLAITYANIGEWNNAAQEYKRVLDLNPYRVEDSLFMLQYGSVLLNANKNDEAKIVFERCQTLPIPEQMPNYQEQVNELLMQISTSS
ncbi:tetratricopeptide repeat protein [Psychrobacillus soli]|uniref:Tetratricopeptide repeat protein n=1 Tax=Psychrobacillus soli TaxID=1543965 RepID=A0A544TL39_9BACI|nr:tetratricopeptide repeat protein [Psychrobacillus soli]TQR18152.1 tetratricopeptide repeat protein [Psychrobacillus soli]